VHREVAVQVDRAIHRKIRIAGTDRNGKGDRRPQVAIPLLIKRRNNVQPIGRASLELRIDVFNVFNRAHFVNPNLTFGTAAFGTINNTRLTPREGQIGLRVLF